jgi:GNAT superfamily N-acetyltransferase
MLHKTITVKTLTVLDESILWDFLYLALYVPPGQPPLPRDIVFQPQISRYVQGWGTANDLGFVAHDGILPVGAAWLRLLIGSEKGYGYVDDEIPELSMAVVSEYRGQGIGTRLLSTLLEQASSQYRSISLSVSEENAARRLYERFGFKTVKKSGSSLIMVKRTMPPQKSREVTILSSP